MTMKISFRIQPTAISFALWLACEIISHLCGIILQQPQWRLEIAGQMVLQQSLTTGISWNCFLQTPHWRIWRSFYQLGRGIRAYSNLASWLLCVESIMSMTSKWSRFRSAFFRTSGIGNCTMRGTCPRLPTAFTMSQEVRRQAVTIARQPSMATIAIAGSALEGMTSGKKRHAQGQPVPISMAKCLKIAWWIIWTRTMRISFQLNDGSRIRLKSLFGWGMVPSMYYSMNIATRRETTLIFMMTWEQPTAPLTQFAHSHSKVLEFCLSSARLSPKGKAVRTKHPFFCCFRILAIVWSCLVSSSSTTSMLFLPDINGLTSARTGSLREFRFAVIPSIGASFVDSWTTCSRIQKTCDGTALLGGIAITWAAAGMPLRVQGWCLRDSLGLWRQSKWLHGVQCLTFGISSRQFQAHRLLFGQVLLSVSFCLRAWLQCCQLVRLPPCVSVIQHQCLMIDPANWFNPASVSVIQHQCLMIDRPDWFNLPIQCLLIHRANWLNQHGGEPNAHRPNLNLMQWISRFKQPKNWKWQKLWECTLTDWVQWRLQACWSAGNFFRLRITGKIRSNFWKECCQTL